VAEQQNGERHHAQKLGKGTTCQEKGCVADQLRVIGVNMGKKEGGERQDYAKKGLPLLQERGRKWGWVIKNPGRTVSATCATQEGGV